MVQEYPETPVPIWRYVHGPIDIESVRRLEAEWGVRFPDDFVACALTSNSGRPVPNTIAFKGWGVTCVKKLLDVHEPDDERAETMRGGYQGLERFLSTGVYPFASEPDGCYDCFDFRVNSNHRRVVFWDHHRADEKTRDDALVPLAETFTEFLDLLYVDVDDDLF